MAYMRLGDLLIAAGAITDEQLQAALQAQKTSGQRLGDLLIDSGVITQHQLIDALQMQLGVDYIDLTRVSIPVELAKYVPRAIAKKYCVVPVKLVKDELYVAMSDPLDFIAQEELKAASRKQIIPMISTRRATEQAIATLYGNEGTARVIEEMKRQAGGTDGDTAQNKLTILYDIPEINVRIKDEAGTPQDVSLRLNIELTRMEDVQIVEGLMPKIVDAVIAHTIELTPDEISGSNGLYWLREELLYRINLIVSPVVVANLNFKAFGIDK